MRIVLVHFQLDGNLLLLDENRMPNDGCIGLARIPVTQDYIYTLVQSSLRYRSACQLPADNAHQHSPYGANPHPTSNRPAIINTSQDIDVDIMRLRHGSLNRKDSTLSCYIAISHTHATITTETPWIAYL